MSRLHQKYLNRSRIGDRWTLDGQHNGPYSWAVIIPALAEQHQLPHTLADLAQSARQLRKPGLVVVVVNHRQSSPLSDMDDNRLTLQALAQRSGDPFDLAWVDATGPNTCLAENEGVGLARKIGMDLVLPYLGDLTRSFIACLDADTRVDSTYLPALAHHFTHHRAGGAVLRFRHQPVTDPQHQRAIRTYEAYLHGTALGLALAGSPYAYVSLGSAIACRADAYVRAGGMNRRIAGEDFYFLQQLRKTVGLSPVQGTCVRPSARLSQRAPFGTGQKVSELIKNPSLPLFYAPDSFELLGRFIRWMRQHQALSGPSLIEGAFSLHPDLGQFVQELGLADFWDRLRHQKPQPQWMNDFHTWFDGLQTVRLLNHLARKRFPRTSFEHSLPPILRKVGREKTFFHL